MVIDKVFDIGTSRNFDYSEVTSVLEEKIPDGFRIMPDSDISEVIKRMGFDEYNFSFIKLGSLEDGRIIFEVEVSNKNKSLKR